MGTPLSSDEVERTRAAMEKHRRPDGSINQVFVAQELGIPRSTAQARIMGIEGCVPGARPPVPVGPQEIRDSAFWKRRSAELSEEAESLRHALAQVTGLIERPVDPPQWALPLKSKPGRVAGLLHISDVHAGEVVKAEEIHGLNSFDLDICRKRLRRLFAATCEILPRWASDCHLEGIVVAMNGDLVSGEAHEDLRETNELRSRGQAWFVADEAAAGIEKLAQGFGRVDVYVTDGNHGRSTLKLRAKQAAQFSYDTMVGELLARHFASDKRVSVHIASGRQCVYSIFGWRVMQTHLDTGGGGGMGFGGPMFPIIRKTKAIEAQGARRQELYDIVLTAHYHTSGNPGKTLANGSVIGFNEFAQSILAAPEPPQQWLALVSEKWCLRERAEIRLA